MFIERYVRPEMGAVWSDEQKFRNWLDVEFAVIEARVSLGEISVQIPPDLASKIGIDPQKIDWLENNPETGVRHDVIAFLQHVSPQFPEELRPWFHHKLTSYDPQDTGLMLTLVKSIGILIGDLSKMLEVLGTLAYRHKNDPQIGRTHGIHAEPITFGVKVANWYAEMLRHLQELQRVKEAVSVGKLSGAVGMYTLSPEVEALALRKLGLRPIVATQVISRDIVSQYVSALGRLASSAAKIAITARGLARTEIRELMEYFSANQRGSSAMPHKKNPVGWENITGLARVVRAFVQVAMENQELWDERDISNSGAERIILPGASILTDYLVSRLSGTLEKMMVFPNRMRENLDIMNGLIYSQDVMALLAEKSGESREYAYGTVQVVAKRCWENGFRLNFFDELKKEPAIMQHVTETELAACFNLEKKLAHVDAIFEMIFG